MEDVNEAAIEIYFISSMTINRVQREQLKIRIHLEIEVIN